MLLFAQFSYVSYVHGIGLMFWQVRYVSRVASFISSDMRDRWEGGR